MNLLERIAKNATRIVGVFSDSAMLCLFMAGVFFIVSMICIRGVVSGLLEMHRSKSALKKLNKKYSFGQKVLLMHAWQDCLHARKFCHFLIICHHCIWVLFLIELLLAVLSSIWSALTPVIAWYTLVFVVGIAIPVCILDFLLDRYPFQKWKHEFTFRKYHNTSDHDSLW